MSYLVQWSSIYSPFAHTKQGYFKPDQNPDWNCPHVAEGWTTWHENDNFMIIHLETRSDQLFTHTSTSTGFNPHPKVAYLNWFTTSSCNFWCNSDNFVSQSDSRIQICHLIGRHGSWSYNWISVQSELEHLQEIWFSLIQI